MERVTKSGPVNGSKSSSPAADVETTWVALEQRLHRLEDAVATLQNTQVMEERVTQRVSERLNRAPATQITAREPAAGGVVLDARRLLPAAADLLRSATTIETPESPATSPAASPAADPERKRPRFALRNGWLLFDLWSDLRAIYLMHVDPRYRMSHLARWLPLVILGLMAVSWLWVPLASADFTLVSYEIDKLVNLLLGFVLFKVWTREARQYREWSPDLPLSLRV